MEAVERVEDAVMGRSRSRRYFTLAEANAQVRAVRRSFDVIMQLRAQAKRLHDRLDAAGYPAQVDDEAQVCLTSADGADMDDEPPPAAVLRCAGMLRAVHAALHEEISQVHATGGVINDLEAGTVDWPSLHRGREVWLRWCYGEGAIGHWLDSPSSCGRRRPLSELEADDA